MWVELSRRDERSLRFELDSGKPDREHWLLVFEVSDSEVPWGQATLRWPSRSPTVTPATADGDFVVRCRLEGRSLAPEEGRAAVRGFLG